MDKLKWSTRPLYIFFEGIVPSILRFGMNSCIMFNMPTIEQYTLEHISLLLRHVFGYYPKSPLDFVFGKDIMEYGQIDVDKDQKFIQ